MIWKADLVLARSVVATVAAAAHSCRSHSETNILHQFPDIATDLSEITKRIQDSQKFDIFANGFLISSFLLHDETLNYKREVAKSFLCFRISKS